MLNVGLNQSSSLRHQRSSMSTFRLSDRLKGKQRTFQKDTHLAELYEKTAKENVQNKISPEPDSSVPFWKEKRNLQNIQHQGETYTVRRELSAATKLLVAVSFIRPKKEEKEQLSSSSASSSAKQHHFSQSVISHRTSLIFRLFRRRRSSKQNEEAYVRSAEWQGNGRTTWRERVPDLYNRIAAHVLGLEEWPTTTARKAVSWMIKQGKLNNPSRPNGGNLELDLLLYWRWIWKGTEKGVEF